MEDKEFIKAREICLSNQPCSQCPFFNEYENCVNLVKEMVGDAE